MAVFLLLLLPLLLEPDREATDVGLGDLPFLIPFLADCVTFLPFFLDRGVVLSESFPLLSLNMLLASADDFSVLFCKRMKKNGGVSM